MKIGDLVKMKPHMFWTLKGNRRKYSDKVGIVLSQAHGAIKVLRSDGTKITDLAENYTMVAPVHDD
tara:strand:- start:837 stop:1034 length:198 start_codon:yes stop_codon:yes gene_type:complete